MPLPRKISPNPLITTSVEVRFSNEIDAVENFPAIYRELPELPKFKEGDVPKVLRKEDPQFRNAPAFTLFNDDYSISFSDNAILFENVSDYKLWDSYFPFIMSNIYKFQKLGLIQKVERVGVRYISVFEHKGALQDVLTIQEQLTYPKASQTKLANIKYSVELQDGVVINLQVGSNSKITRGDHSFTGIVVDVDSFIPISGDDYDLKGIINRLHNEEKEFFFSILNPEFLKKLNPEY
jgi:uncharacterized protein (TIGR04255 family)